MFARKFCLFGPQISARKSLPASLRRIINIRHKFLRIQKFRLVSVNFFGFMKRKQLANWGKPLPLELSLVENAANFQSVP